ncbi:MAG: chemotaxis protein [Anaerolineaceae bacterium]|nr:MAG: chemotaxis protein [Anaerolineaceae bacterium]
MTDETFDTDNENDDELYIVGLGTSAGGLEALERFFKQMPVNPRIAFCVVQHLSPDYKSHMVELLSKYTPITVQQATDGVEVKGGNIYLLPPKKNMTIFKNKLYLVDYDRSHGLNLPIDILFESLAKNSQSRAIACILSGTGSDGTRGIRAIKEYGGIVLTQDDSAKFDGMPRSAIATHLVDYTTAPEGMTEIILRYIAHPHPMNTIQQPPASEHEDRIDKVLAILHDQNNMDFTGYKLNTLIRRIERRMSLFEISDLRDYITYLERSANERRILVKEFLIGVTRFLRDTEAFDYMRTEIIPALLKDRARRDQVRVWVPACSTGEEAYSLAILFQDYMEHTGHFVDVKIFATDIDRDALNTAGIGIFPESVLADIPEHYLERYFVREGDNYQILRAIRGMVVFAYQNLISDPPFSRIDLVSCRNVLIYLTPKVQNRILSTFQFSLKRDGYLFLGSSESLGDRGADFTIKSAKWKIYQYIGNYRPTIPQTDTPQRRPIIPREPLPEKPATTAATGRGQSDPVLQSIVEQVLPPAIVINPDMQLIHAFGDVAQYLRPPHGYQVNLNVLNMLPEELVTPLSTAIHRTLSEEIDVTYRQISVGEQDRAHFVTLKTRVFWQRGTQGKLVLITFEREPLPEDHKPEDDERTTYHPSDSVYHPSDSVNQRIFNLEQELQFTRENLQATIEELETSNEELQATNEELMAANEELQSTNEELESVNEELLTVNNEHQIKIRELSALNDDVNNLLRSIDIGTVFLDADLRVRKFTPAAQESINLLDQDIGRPMSHFAHQFVTFDLNERVLQVMETLASTECEVEHRDGRWLLIRIMPYRTHANQITGVVMTMVDITELKQTAQQAESSSHYAQTILNSLAGQIAVLDETGVIRQVNESWRQFAIDNGMPAHHSDIGTNYLEVCKNARGPEAGGAPETYDGLLSVMRGETNCFDVVYPCHAPHEERWFLLRAVPLRGSEGSVVVSHINITEQKQSERALARSEQRLALANDPSPLCLFEHDNLLNYLWIDNQNAPYVPQSGVGKNDRDFLSRADAGYLTALKQDCLLNKQSAEERLTLTYDGVTHTCHIKLDVVIGDSGQAIGLIGIYRDFQKAD